MSALLQRVPILGASTGIFVVDGVAPPFIFHNGLPYEANGALCVDTNNGVANYHQGLPFTVAGRLVTKAGVLGFFGSGAAPFITEDTLLIKDLTVPTVFSSGVGYTTASEIATSLVAPAGDQVELVLARMSALDATETSAITTYIDGLVADGIYANITEIYAPCLNGTDYKTGFKSRTLIDSPTAPVHTPGQYADFTTGTRYFLESVDFDSYATVDGFIGIYNVFTGADSAANSDMCGIATAGVECYMRWRGNDTNDFNAIFNVTSATPRTAANVRPTGDIIGFGLDGTDLFVLEPGGIVVKATRTPVANVPANFPLQWHGQNIDGTPSTGNVQNSRYSLMLTGNSITDANAVQARARSLQFLRDIGVTGVPAT